LWVGSGGKWGGVVFFTQIGPVKRDRKAKSKTNTQLFPHDVQKCGNRSKGSSCIETKRKKWEERTREKNEQTLYAQTKQQDAAPKGKGGSRGKEEWAERGEDKRGIAITKKTKGNQGAPGGKTED